MYEEYLEALLTYVKALNGAAKATENGDQMLTPYVNNVPVLLEDGLCGFITDEIGGIYQYREATDEDLEWWALAPWNKGKRR